MRARLLSKSNVKHLVIRRFTEKEEIECDLVCHDEKGKTAASIRVLIPQDAFHEELLSLKNNILNYLMEETEDGEDTTDASRTKTDGTPQL